MIRRTALLVGLLLLLAGKSAADAPFHEDQGACPFECCTYKEWTTKERTIVHQSRDNKSSIAFVLEPSEIVLGVTGVVVTLKPGRTTVLQPISVTCGQDKVAAVPGEVFDLLHYEGEGFFKFKYRGKICSDEIPWPESMEKQQGFGADRRPINKYLRTDSLPETVWWVNVQNNAGKVGWSDEATHFAHVDACE